MNELLVLQEIKPVQVFVANGLDPIIERIEKEVKSEVLDISTKEGRERIASLAYKVAKSKTALDEMGKKLTEDWKKQSKAVDAERARAWDKLEALQKEIRKPLTDWENAEKDRIAAHEAAIAEIVLLATAFEGLTAADIEKRIARSIEISGSRNWEEFAARGKHAHDTTHDVLLKKLDARIKFDAEQAELAKLRQEKAEREQKDRDERIAAEAAAKAKADAEAEAKRKADAEAAKVKAEQDRAEQERVRLQREKDEAEARTKAAEEKAKRDVEAAAKAERDRIAAEKKAEADATAKREADKKHRAKINNEALNSIIEVCNSETVDVTPAIAKAVVEAIAKGLITHIKITY